MLIEFRGEHTGAIVMFGHAATSLLKMMGQSGKPEGALREEDVAAALAQLRTELETLATESQPAAPQSDDEDENDPVRLDTRAIPLIQLLENCVEKGGYLMWQPK